MGYDRYFRYGSCRAGAVARVRALDVHVLRHSLAPPIAVRGQVCTTCGVFGLGGAWRSTQTRRVCNTLGLGTRQIPSICAKPLLRNDTAQTHFLNFGHRPELEVCCRYRANAFQLLSETEFGKRKLARPARYSTGARD